MSENVYHLKPTPFKGSQLLPLSILEQKYPALAINEQDKYKDRKELQTKEIPLLKANWSEVLFLSCLNPTLIFIALELLGLLDLRNIPEILAFPIQTLKKQPSCLYQEDEQGKETFKAFKLNDYKEVTAPPNATLQYFLQCVKTGEKPLLFFGVPHVLLKGSLPISEAKTIQYQPITSGTNRD